MESSTAAVLILIYFWKESVKWSTQGYMHQLLHKLIVYSLRLLMNERLYHGVCQICKIWYAVPLHARSIVFVWNKRYYYYTRAPLKGDFKISFIIHFCIYPNTWLIRSKWSCSGQIHISIIRRSHKILEKFFLIASVYGRSLDGIDRAGICEPGTKNDTVEKWVVSNGTDTLKMVCTDTKNKIIQ